MQTAEDLLRNLNQIDMMLTSIQRKEFLENWIRWKNKREASISNLEEIKKENDTFNSTVEITQTISKGIAVIGLATTAYGIFNKLTGDDKKDEEINNALMYGGATAAVGGVGVACCASKQIGNTIVVDKTVQEALRQDENMTEELLPFLLKSEELDELCKKTFDCSIASVSFRHLLTIITKIDSYCTGGQLTYSEILTRLTETKNVPLPNVDFMKNDTKISLNFLSNITLKTKEFLTTYCNNPLVRDITLKICESCNNTVLQGFSTSVRAIQDLRIIAKNPKINCSNFLAGLDLYDTVANNPNIPINCAAIPLNVLFPIKCAIKIVRLIGLSKDINKETEKCSERLKDIIYCLNLQLETLQLVHNHLAAIEKQTKNHEKPEN